MLYILKISRNGTPLISFTPSDEPIPKLIDKERKFKCKKNQ